jgi:hypothetical protein
MMLELLPLLWLAQAQVDDPRCPAKNCEGQDLESCSSSTRRLLRSKIW